MTHTHTHNADYLACLEKNGQFCSQCLNVTFTALFFFNCAASSEEKKQARCANALGLLHKSSALCTTYTVLEQSVQILD